MKKILIILTIAFIITEAIQICKIPNLYSATKNNKYTQVSKNSQKTFKILKKVKDSKHIKINDYKLPKNLREELKQKVWALHSNAGISIIDLSSQQALNWNPKQKFYAASLIKAPFITSLGKANASSLRNYKWSMLRTIRQSSNEQFFRLYKIYGGSYLRQFLNSSSVNANTSPCCANVFFSALDMTKIWTNSYKFFFSNHKRAQETRNIFQHAPNPINDILANNKCKTYTKFGWMGGYGRKYDASHVSGIIKCDKQTPFIMSIMTNIPLNVKKLNPIVRILNRIHNNMIKQFNKNKNKNKNKKKKAKKK